MKYFIFFQNENLTEEQPNIFNASSDLSARLDYLAYFPSILILCFAIVFVSSQQRLNFMTPFK